MLEIVNTFYCIRTKALLVFELIKLFSKLKHLWTEFLVCKTKFNVDLVRGTRHKNKNTDK